MINPTYINESVPVPIDTLVEDMSLELVDDEESMGVASL